MHPILTMNTRTVYQIDRAGVYQGETQADESPKEPGVWIMPALTVETPPPTDYPSDKWPRWNGSAWTLTGRPQVGTMTDTVAKLQDFLASNPDVAALLNAPTDQTASTAKS